MANLPDKQDENEYVSPLNLAELRLRLQRGDPGQYAAHAEVMREIIGLGAAASSLIPVIVEQFRADKLKRVPVSDLVELYLQSRDQGLLDMLREKNAFHSISVFQKCQLFKAGVSELEPDLLDWLWREWIRPGNSDRVEIVKSVGQAGGPSALEMLEVIRYKMAAQVQEGKAKLHGQSEEDIRENLDIFLSVLETRANESFLEEVRSAINQLKNRGVG